jgi:hypothetical protein
MTTAVRRGGRVTLGSREYEYNDPTTMTMTTTVATTTTRMVRTVEIMPLAWVVVAVVGELGDGTGSRTGLAVVRTIRGAVRKKIRGTAANGLR